MEMSRSYKFTTLLSEIDRTDNGTMKMGLDTDYDIVTYLLTGVNGRGPPDTSLSYTFILQSDSGT